jgi:hypothetical protein
MAEISTFRGEALKNRVLAAHPPGRPSGKSDDEFIASLPLAAAAIAELYSDIAQKSPVFAPIIIGSSLDTSEEVFQLLKAVRFVVETERHCSSLWHHSVFRGFVKLSRDRSEKSQRIVRVVVARREARSHLSGRIEALMHQARATRHCEHPFSLQSVEDVWTIVLALQARKNGLPVNFLEEIEALSLVESFAATQPGRRINAIDFAAGEGAALMVNIMVPNQCKWRDDYCLAHSFVADFLRDFSAGYNSRPNRDQPCIHDTMHRLLSSPRILPLVFRFWKNGEMSSLELRNICLTSLLSSAIATENHDDNDDDVNASDALRNKPGMSIKDALAVSGMDACERTIAMLEQALSQNLCVEFEGGDLVPDGFSSPLWYSMAIPEIQSVIIATGLYSPNVDDGSSNTPNQDEVPATHAAVAQAIECALLTLSKHSWLVRNTRNSMHPFTDVKAIAVHLLVVGEYIAAAAQRAGQADFGGFEAIASRYKKHWKSIFKRDGPPQDCPGGYHSCMFDCSCLSCGMPHEYCPSLFRLRIEIREFMAQNCNESAAEDFTEVTLMDACAVAATLRGVQLIPGAPPIVQEAAAAMFAGGLLQKNRNNWSFSGPMRPVLFNSPDLRNVVLEMKPIT